MLSVFVDKPETVSPKDGPRTGDAVHEKRGYR